MKAKLSIPAPAWNKTEAAFANDLELKRRAGTIEWWAFEPIKLRIASKCFYTPDFGVLDQDGAFHFYEVKGFWRDDARVKLKAAVRLFPMFRFHAVTKTREGWQYENF